MIDKLLHRYKDLGGNFGCCTCRNLISNGIVHIFYCDVVYRALKLRYHPGKFIYPLDELILTVINLTLSLPGYCFYYNTYWFCYQKILTILNSTSKNKKKWQLYDITIYLISSEGDTRWKHISYKCTTIYRYLYFGIVQGHFFL